MRHLISAVAISLAAAMPVQADVPPELADKKAFVEEAEQGEYLYWKRIIDRLELTDEWSPPASWYAPRVVVEGGEQSYFPPQNGKSTIRKKAIKKAWAYALERNTQALLIVHKGKSVAELYAPGEHRGSVINARSMTKTLMALLFGTAIADGKVGSLDDPIKLYIKEWDGDPRGEITIRTYLHNISGLEFPTTAAPGTKASRMVNGTHVDDVALSFGLDPALDGKFVQNNAGTQILGIALQRAVGEPFNTYLSRKIWRPIGASRALMKEDRIGGSVVTYCCLQSSATDWVRVGHMLMTGGKGILPKGWVDEMLTPSTANPNYGLHIWIGSPHVESRSYAPVFEWAMSNTHSEPFKAGDLFYLDGGAKTRVWIVPSLDLVIARLGNRPPKSLGFDEAFIPNTIIEGLRD